MCINDLLSVSVGFSQFLEAGLTTEDMSGLDFTAIEHQVKIYILQH